MANKGKACQDVAETACVHASEKRRKKLKRSRNSDSEDEEKEEKPANKQKEFCVYWRFWKMACNLILKVGYWLGK